MAYEVQTIGQIIGAVAILLVFYFIMNSFFNKGKNSHGKPIKIGILLIGIFFTLIGLLVLIMAIGDAFIRGDFEPIGLGLLLIMGLLPLTGGILMILMATGRWKAK